MAVKVRLTALAGAGTVGLISHGAGVKWGGFTYTSMQAVRNGASFDIFGSTSISCAVSSTLVVPDDGTAGLVLLAPRLTVADLDGRAIMIHSGADDYTDAHPGGDRAYCGIVE